MKSPQPPSAMSLALSLTEPTHKTQPPPNSARRAIRAVATHKSSIILLMGFWLLSVMVSWLSILDIISPGAEPQLSPEIVAPASAERRQLPRKRVSQPPPAQQDSPLGVLGAITGGCVIFSLLLSRKISQR